MLLRICRPTQKIIQIFLKCIKNQNYIRFISLTPVLFPRPFDDSTAKEATIAESRFYLPSLKEASDVRNTILQRSMHSFLERFDMGSLKILTLPAGESNLMYLIIDVQTNEAAVVDPFDVTLVLKYIKKMPNLKLSTILTTHFHYQHSGGNKKLLQLTKNIPEVYGSQSRIPALTRRIHDNDIITFGNSTIKCISTPFHTSGDMCYFVESPNKDIRALFTGDTLYQAGCGKVIEGSYYDLHKALYKKLAKLPDDTLIFGGHENTVENLLFAMKVDPENYHIQRRLNWAETRRSAKYSTIPSTLMEEKLWNPYLRVHTPSIKTITKENDNVRALNKLKDMEDLYMKGELV
ncbi:hydroxyacylglutathione hydrolase, mitochondrial-like [Teleopsis dalmanni]|uniref:hydroxyacylglutathione hydrolase, mitochondrial-like n=1 Tax=Teleopsis dalmanni TaxID=139649 RepID=UPI0018CE99B9|nr:hydroxyacylglutathione hydrolase, mitochondrial-like [Teleopsis dalmanni]